VYADITLINALDQLLCDEGQLKENKIRKVKAKMLVDSGAYMMAINEETMTQLGLTSKEERSATLADGSIIVLPIVKPIYVEFENRNATCSAMVLPGNSEMLLGAIPMEEMDVLIHPNMNTLVVNPAHPYMPQLSLK
jgi:clan AA aspartic protease